MTKKFSIEQQHLDKLYTITDVNEAREYSEKLLAKTSTSDLKKAKLKVSLSKARTASKVIEIMLNVVLAGEGQGTFTSSWNRT